MVTPGLVDAARRHALVRRLDHHRHALGLQHLLDAMGDLGVHLLLDLQAAGKGIHHARQLGNAHHLVVGQIADMGTADDGREMMLAMGFETDVLERSPSRHSRRPPRRCGADILPGHHCNRRTIPRRRAPRARAFRAGPRDPDRRPPKESVCARPARLPLGKVGGSFGDGLSAQNGVVRGFVASDMDSPGRAVERARGAGLVNSGGARAGFQAGKSGSRHRRLRLRSCA